MGPRVRGDDGLGDGEDAPRPFTAIDTWVFDLDNTWYPHHSICGIRSMRDGEFAAPGSRYRRMKRA